MSRAPREFKFVGGPSRKRRRNAAPPKPRASRASFTVKPAAATRTCGSGPDLVEDKGPGDPLPPVTSSTGAEDVAPSAPAPAPDLISDGLAAGLDWPNRSFMDSLTDMSFWFTDDIVPSTDTTQAPLYFGLETPLYPIGSPPIHEATYDKTEGAPEEGLVDDEPRVHCSSTESTSPAAAKPTPQSIVSNSMDTVSRLLDLCTRPSPAKIAVFANETR